jgi:hypothetical protein
VKDLGKNVLGIGGYLFAGLLVVFTATQTYALLFDVSASHVTAIIGLVLFEGGMLYWWQVFRREADGIPQMGISIIMFVVGLLLVTAAVALHLGAVDIEFLGDNTPARIIIVAVLLNLIAKLIYPLVAPAVFTVITERAHEGKILAGTYKKFEAKINDITDEVSDEMAEVWVDRTRENVLGSWTSNLNRRNGKHAAAGDDWPADDGNGNGAEARPTKGRKGGR